MKTDNIAPTQKNDPALATQATGETAISTKAVGPANHKGLGFQAASVNASPKSESGGVKDVRETYVNLFGGAFVEQNREANPDVKKADAGLNNWLAVDPKTLDLMDPVTFADLSAKGASLSGLSWTAESESKLQVDGREEFDEIHTSLLEAVESNDLGRVLGKAGETMAAEGWTIIKQVEDQTFRQFKDDYYGVIDENGVDLVSKAGQTIRARYVGEENIENGIGRVICKFVQAPTESFESNPVWYRGEMKLGLEDDVTVPMIMGQEIPDEINPVSYLVQLVPGLKDKEFEPVVTIFDKRHEFQLVDPDGNPQFLVTLDDVTAEDPKKRRGTYQEIEIERTNPDDTPKANLELRRMSMALKNNFDLRSSTVNKPARGLIAINSQN